LAVLLFAALAAAPLTAGIEKRRTFLMLALGALAAALCLVKANAGVFASAALAMTFAACGQRTPAWRAIAVTIAVACTVLPFVLMRNHLDALWARSYCWVEVAAVAGCVANMLRLRRVPLITRGDCIQAAAGFASTVTAIVAVLKMQGVPVFAVYDSLLVAPARIFLEHRTWFHAPDLMKLTSVWAAVGLSVALFSAWKQPLRGTAVWNTLFAGKLLFCVIAIAAALTRRPLLPVVAPFVWLLLFNPSQTDDESQSFPRGMLAILTVLQALYAYPVAGNQYHLIQVLIWVAVVVCVGDTLSWFADYWRLREKSMRWGRAAATSALVMVALLHVRVGLGRYQTYQELSPLDLPGARLLRVDNETRENFKLLVSNLKQHCDSLESYPGLRSLNFWSGLNPVTGLNIDNWAQSFSAEQEQKVVAALSMHPHACVVYDLRLAEFWNPGQENLDHHPLVGYIFRNFQPVSESGDYQLMMRKDRIRTAASSPAPSLGPVYSR
jgi:hypothetical protein